MKDPFSRIVCVECVKQLTLCEEQGNVYLIDELLPAAETRRGAAASQEENNHYPSLEQSAMPAETAGTEVGRAAWMWMAMRMEDGQDWQDAHMGSREIIVGGGWRRGLITRGWHGAVSSVCCSTSASLALGRISQHAHTGTGSGDLLVLHMYLCSVYLPPSFRRKVRKRRLGRIKDVESNQVRGDVCPLGEETVNRSLVIDSCSTECVYILYLGVR